METRELSGIVGAAHVLTDPDAMAGYLTDWTGKWTGAADAVVRPRTTDEVAAILRYCATVGATVSVQGGNTGLVGGSIPPRADSDPRPAILLSTTRMADIDAVDEADRCVGAQAGASVAAIDAAARAHGLMFGVDLAARDSATAGGVVATNAGGIRMIRHGNTRTQVLGIEAVRADGEVLRRWSPLVKDNVGYDLPGLLTGSEGTLAVLTRVLFRLVTPPPDTVVAVAGVDDVGTAATLLAGLGDRGRVVEAAEVMTAAGIELVHAHGARRPLATEASHAVLLEVSGPGDVEADLLQVLDTTPGVVDAVLEPGPAPALWAIREGHTEAIARSSTTPVVKLDVSVPLGELPVVFTELCTLAETSGYSCRPILFGHVGDGNIHVNMLDVPTEYERDVTERVFAIVTAHRGSISAEHGIGRAKTEWTGLGRTPTDLGTMRAIKAALDPTGMLNPGVLFAR